MMNVFSEKEDEKWEMRKKETLVWSILFCLFYKKHLKQKIQTVSILILDGGFTDISLILWTLFFQY